MKLNETFQIDNSLEGLDELKTHLNRIAASWGLSKKILFETNIIIEEICTNYMEHVEHNLHSPVEVELCLKDNILLIVITETGPKFDPTKTSKPDIHLPLEERKAGGLGLYLVQYYADSISYTRKKNTNILSVTKIIK